MEALLSAKQMTCCRGEKMLFQHFSMDLREGEICQIVGPNGVGKTSLLKILSGLLSPQSGEIFWKGKSIKAESSHYFQEMFYLGHDQGVKEELTVWENLVLDCRYGFSSEEIIDDALERMNLQSHKKKLCAHLSQGQRQRVALAKLLITKKPLWILDEPLNTLDSSGVKLLESLLKSKVEKKESVILSTHRALHLVNVPLRTLALGSMDNKI